MPSGATRRRVAIAAAALVAVAAVVAWSVRDRRETTSAETPTRAANGTVADPGSETRRADPPRRRAAGASAKDVVVPPAAEAPTLRVVVRSEPGGAAVADAAVTAEFRSERSDTVQRFEATTDAAGTATVARAEADGVVQVWKDGFVTAAQKLDGDTQEVVVDLRPGETARGRVVRADTCAPVDGATVCGDLLWETPRVTDADGRFEVPNETAASVTRLYVVKQGFRSVVWDAKDHAGEPIEIALGRGGVVAGTVYDASGRAVPGVDVFMIPSTLEPPRGARPANVQEFLFPPNPTDAEGRFEFRGVPLEADDRAPPRVLVARAPGGREARSGPFVCSYEGERVLRDLRFEGPGAIVVRVRSAGGLERLRASVSAVGTRRRTIVDATTEATASARFDDVPSGVYEVEIEPARDPSWRLSRERVSVASGSVTTVEFERDATTDLVGRVMEADGRPVAFARVEFSGETEDGVSATAKAATEDDGTFVLRRVPATAGRLDVEPCGGVWDDELPLAAERGRSVTPGADPLTIVLHRAIALAGRVTPVPPDHRLVVDVRADDTTMSRWAEVDEDGRFTCVVTSHGTRMFVALRAGDSAPVLIVRGTPPPPGSTTDLGEVRLDAGLALDLVFQDASGRPLARTGVACLDFWMRNHRAITDGAGRVRLTGVPRHPLRLWVMGTETTPSARPVIPDPAAPPAVVTIASGALVTGCVVDAAGNAPKAPLLLSFRVKTDEPDTDGKTTWARTDADGAFRVRLEPALYRVLVRDVHQGPALSDAVDLGVADGETRTLDIRLR